MTLIRVILLALSAVAITAAMVFHGHTREQGLQLEAERTLASKDLVDTRRRTAEVVKQVSAAKEALQTSLKAQTKRSATNKKNAVTTKANQANSAPTLPAATVDPAFRRLQTQAFVSEQRLYFAGLLRRVGFTTGQLQAFDAIQAEYLTALLEASSSDGRARATSTRETKLQDLFGPAHGQWVEANRSLPSRAKVAQIVQQTFQSSGALTLAQADELARLLDEHRISPSQKTGRQQEQHDWDRIVSEARGILDERQVSDFVVAIEYRRASEKMSAIAAKKKP